MDTDCHCRINQSINQSLFANAVTQVNKKEISVLKEQKRFELIIRPTLSVSNR